MKLVTHNFLACNIKGVKNGFPLKIDATSVEIRDADFDPGATGLVQVTVLLCWEKDSRRLLANCRRFYQKDDEEVKLRCFEAGCPADGC